MQHIVRTRSLRARHVLGGAALGLLLPAAGLLAVSWPEEPAPSRLQTLRAAFDQASDECYRDFRGPELQGCLAGVMEAHLQALGGAEPPDAESAGLAKATLQSL